MSTFRAVVIVIALAALAASAFLWLSQADEPAASGVPVARWVPWPLTGLPAGSLTAQRTSDQATIPIEVCGVGVVMVQDGQAFPKELNALLNWRLSALEASVESLASSGKPDERAIGLYVRRVVTVARASEAAMTPVCERDPQCAANANAIGKAAGAADEALLRAHALTSADPLSRSLLSALCDWRDGACLLEAATRWAEVDGDNALAWLAVLNAAPPNDRHTIDRALARAAAAPQAQYHFHRLMLPALTDGMTVAPPLDQAAAQIAMMGIVAAWVVDYRPLLTVCSAKEIAHPERRKQCGQVAATLYEHDPTLLGRRMAASIGQQLGWPQARLDAVRDLSDAQVELAERSGELDPARMFNCKALRNMGAFMRDFAAEGEVAAIRRRIAESGVGVDALARAARDRRMAPRPVK